MANASPARCGVVAPESLTGHLGRLKCALVVDDHHRHSGDHRAHKTIPNVGKVKVTWKNHDRAKTDKLSDRAPVVYSGGPPVVRVRADAQQNGYLTGRMRQTPKCACPDWWRERGEKMHHSPCVLL